MRDQGTAPSRPMGPPNRRSETRLPVHDLPFQSAVDQLSALASGEVSSEELLDVYLSRIDAHNRTLNAIVTLDVDRARRDARNADAKRESKKARRQQAKQLAREELQMGCGNLNATRSNKLSREKF